MPHRGQSDDADARAEEMEDCEANEGQAEGQADHDSGIRAGSDNIRYDLSADRLGADMTPGAIELHRANIAGRTWTLTLPSGGTFAFRSNRHGARNIALWALAGWYNGWAGRT